VYVVMHFCSTTCSASALLFLPYWGGLFETLRERAIALQNSATPVVATCQCGHAMLCDKHRSRSQERPGGRGRPVRLSAVQPPSRWVVTRQIVRWYWKMSFLFSSSGNRPLPPCETPLPYLPVATSIYRSPIHGSSPSHLTGGGGGGRSNVHTNGTGTNTSTSSRPAYHRSGSGSGGGDTSSSRHRPRTNSSFGGGASGTGITGSGKTGTMRSAASSSSSYGGGASKGSGSSSTKACDSQSGGGGDDTNKGGGRVAAVGAAATEASATSTSGTGGGGLQPWTARQRQRHPSSVSPRFNGSGSGPGAKEHGIDGDGAGGENGRAGATASDGGSDVVKIHVCDESRGITRGRGKGSGYRSAWKGDSWVLLFQADVESSSAGSAVSLCGCGEIFLTFVNALGCVAGGSMSFRTRPLPSCPSAFHPLRLSSTLCVWIIETPPSWPQLLLCTPMVWNRFPVRARVAAARDEVLPVLSSRGELVSCSAVSLFKPVLFFGVLEKEGRFEKHA